MKCNSACEYSKSEVGFADLIAVIAGVECLPFDEEPKKSCKNTLQ
jgi:hypothetical protein